MRTIDKVIINGIKHIRTEDNNCVWYYDNWNQYHREDNGPAVLTSGREFYWYKHG